MAMEYIKPSTKKNPCQTFRFMPVGVSVTTCGFLGGSRNLRRICCLVPQGWYPKTCYSIIAIGQ
jgi:hypothetical protein